MKKIILCVVSFSFLFLFAQNLALAQEAAKTSPEAVSSSSGISESSAGRPSEGTTVSTSVGASGTVASGDRVTEKESTGGGGGGGDGNAESPAKSTVPESRTIRLRAETLNGTLYDQTLSVTACPISSANPLETINARCAILQSGLKSEWLYDGAWLESLGGITNGNGIYWQWFLNLEYGLTALNAHVLTDGEEILLTFGIFPLKLSVSATNPHVGETIGATIYEFGFDGNWNPTWFTSLNSTMIVNGQSFFTPTGTREIAVNSNSSFNIRGVKNGFISTSPTAIFPVMINVPQSANGQGILIIPPQQQNLNHQQIIKPTNSAFLVEHIGRVPVLREDLYLPVSERIKSLVKGMEIKPESQFAASVGAWSKNMRLPMAMIFGILILGSFLYLFKQYL